VAGDKDFGSVGRAAYKLLTKAKIKDKVYNNALYLTTDSRRITNALKNNEADLTLNWYATSFWNENKDLVTALELSKNIAKPKAIEVNLLKFSHNKNLARKFIDFASSSYGKEVFYNYGFFTPEEYKNQK
jgi:molybdate transport system substrate-binding protein